MMFAHAWILALLLLLPLLWRLLRVTPPVPRSVVFFATMFLPLNVEKNNTAQKSPWWLVLLRLLFISVIIVAAAKPLSPVQVRIKSNTARVVVVDNSFAAAKNWQQIRGALQVLGKQAVQTQQPFYVLPLVSAAPLRPLPLDPQAFDALLGTLTPYPLVASMDVASTALDALKIKEKRSLEVIFLSSGVLPQEQLQMMQQRGFQVFVSDAKNQLSVILQRAEKVADGVRVNIMRFQPAAQPVIQAVDKKGQVLASLLMKEDEAVLPLPFALQKNLHHLEIAGATTLAEKFFADSAWQQPPVGIILAAGATPAKNLLEERYYIEKAFSVFTEVKQGTLAELLQQKMPVLVWADSVSLRAEERETLEKWVASGGVLLRFAGEGMATTKQESLLPVRLRYGVQQFDTALAWGKAPDAVIFSKDTPLAFEGREVAHIIKRVLAEPSVDVADKTFATFSDGAPFLTASRKGAGWLLLCHVAALPDWSDVVLQKQFLAMLQQISQLAGGTPTAKTGKLPLQSWFDAFGTVRPPLEGMEGMPADTLSTEWLSFKHPAGFYGTAQGQIARQMGVLLPKHVSVADAIDSTLLSAIQTGSARDVQRQLLWGAAALFLLDWLVTLLLQGGKKGGKRRFFAVVCCALLPINAHAEEIVPTESLAYIETGYADVDNASAKGLLFLTQTLEERTNVTLAPPKAVRLGADDMSTYPFVYFPLIGAVPPLNDKAWQALQRYIANDGLLLIDTRTGQPPLADAEAMPQLGALLRSLVASSFVPLPPKHLLLRSYYILKGMEGEFTTELFLPATTLEKDKMAGVLLGSQNFAKSWARGNNEMAYRSGANMVLYALTGTYKNDQIHLKAVLERLSQ